MRLAIIGGGFGVSAHLPAFSAMEGVEVVALADAGSGRARAHASSGIAYAPSWEAALERAELDAVSVAVPPRQQREIVMQALERGLHVFCEKPFGASVEEAHAMVLRARERELVGAVNFQFRFEPGIEAMRSALRDGSIGRLLGVDLSWLSEGRARADSPWSWQHDAAAGGGVVRGFFSHGADLFYWLAGADAEVVFAQTGILIDERRDREGRARAVTAEDFVVAQIRLHGGAVATCRISNCQPGGSGMRIEVRGDRGILLYRNWPPFGPNDCTLQRLGQKGSIETLPIPAHPSAPSVDSRVLPVSRCACAFVRAVKGHREVEMPGFEDGLRVQRVMQALGDSAVSGRQILING